MQLSLMSLVPTPYVSNLTDFEPLATTAVVTKQQDHVENTALNIFKVNVVKIGIRKAKIKVYKYDPKSESVCIESRRMYDVRLAFGEALVKELIENPELKENSTIINLVSWKNSHPSALSWARDPSDNEETIIKSLKTAEKTHSNIKVNVLTPSEAAVFSDLSLKHILSQLPQNRLTPHTHIYIQSFVSYRNSHYYL